MIGGCHCRYQREQVLHGELRVVDVAIVVVKDVLAPVGRAAEVIGLGFLVDLVAVIPVGSSGRGRPDPRPA